MAHDMDGLFEEQRQQSPLLRRDELIQFGELDAHIVPSGEEPDPAEEQDESPVAAANPKIATETGGTDVVKDGVVAPVGVREANFSRDLIDTYFRQMGNAELLSREQELALKRVELLLELVGDGPPERLDDRDQRREVGDGAAPSLAGSLAVLAHEVLPGGRCLVSPPLVHPRPSRR